MRKGFELLKTRKEDVPTNFEDLEKAHQVSILDLFKIFLENFSLEERVHDKFHFYEIKV